MSLSETKRRKVKVRGFKGRLYAKNDSQATIIFRTKDDAEFYCVVPSELIEGHADIPTISRL